MYHLHKPLNQYFFISVMGPDGRDYDNYFLSTVVLLSSEFLSHLKLIEIFFFCALFTNSQQALPTPHRYVYIFTRRPELTKFQQSRCL